MPLSVRGRPVRSRARGKAAHACHDGVTPAWECRVGKIVVLEHMRAEESRVHERPVGATRVLSIVLTFGGVPSRLASGPLVGDHRVSEVVRGDGGVTRG